MGKIRITVKITRSRYQVQKELGKEYRESSESCSFTEFKRKKKADEIEEAKKEEESKTFIPESCTENIMTIGSEKTFKKVSKKKLSPKRIDKLQ